MVTAPTTAGRRRALSGTARPLTPIARVALTDAQERAGLAAIRCLGAGGYAVTATADRVTAPGLWSRHCSQRRVLPSPTEDLEGFIAGLERILTSCRHDLLIPGTDASLFAISLTRERLQGLAGLALAPHPVVERCLSKRALLDAAARAGLHGPETLLCDSQAAALRAARRLGFPVIVKPDAVICRQGKRLVRRASALAGDEQVLRGALREPGPWLVQRFVRRPIISIAGVVSEGDLAALVATRYLRLWPIDAGNGSFIETFAPPEELVNATGRLMCSLGWSGIFQLELADMGGRLAALDLNPRPYGSLGIARAAGVPLCSIWCEGALAGRRADINGQLAPLHGPGKGRRAPLIGRAPIRYRVEDVDARHAAALLRAGRWREAMATAPRRGVAHAYFQAGDPLPLAARALQLAGRRLPVSRRW
jgi:predicted ATP-grasp superfamily ATP-dependent carboligase